MKKIKTLAPTHKFVKSGKPCVKINIKHVISEEDILNVIDFLLSDGATEKEITRKKVKEELTLRLKYRGADDLEYLVYETQNHPEKTKALATRIFPDWFASQSIQFIMED